MSSTAVQLQVCVQLEAQSRLTKGLHGRGPKEERGPSSHLATRVDRVPVPVEGSERPMAS